MFNVLLDDIIEMKLWYTANNDRALNVRHYQVTNVSAGAGVLTSQSLADQLFTNFSIALQNAMSIDATFDAVSVQRLTPLPKTVATFSAAAAAPGAELTPVLPRQVAGLISLYTAFAGPANRGRFYMPYPAESANDIGGVPNAAYLLLLAGVRDEVVQTQIVNNAVGNSTLTPCIVHRAGGPVTFITSGVTRNAWATQRRRQNARF